MPDLKNLPRRQAAKVFVRAILDALDMCPSELARLTGYDPSTVLRYRAGQSVPSRAFTLDLLDKAPNAGFTFEQVARVLGYRWPGSRDPEKYNSFAEYFSATRLLSKRSRDQFAIKLGVPPYVVRELEMGGLPDRKVLLSFARNLHQASPSMIWLQDSQLSDRRRPNYVYEEGLWQYVRPQKIHKERDSKKISQ